MSRPEDTLAADVHYDDIEARKYTTSSRIQNIQASMTRRALELLDLKGPSLILDVGCGSGHYDGGQGQGGSAQSPGTAVGHARLVVPKGCGGVGRGEAQEG
ncbi:hypothetical protein NLG97_g10032 [Lecanicillium saksenae]|uniref:Uncharacterized protein n=1 Tax=Lecanicillium saksenae TaxID=468837 RepID=A0ACC1QG13_9HYPO|nr:hypothetical protein NLG97_g10032 [Lecanicillium saksenae]